MSATRRDAKAPPFTEWHGNTFRAKVRIPQKLRFLFPIAARGAATAKTTHQRFIYKELGTSDPCIAEEAARIFVADARRRFILLSRQASDNPNVIAEARRWREQIERIIEPKVSLSAENDTHATMTAEDLETLGDDPTFTEFDALVHRTYDLEKQLGHARALNFFNLASGRTRNIHDEMEEWLCQSSYSEATQKRYRRIIRALINWCLAHRISSAMEEIDQRRADRFLSRAVGATRRSKALINEKAALSSFWEFSNSRHRARLTLNMGDYENWIGDAGANPWLKASAQKSSKP